MRMFMSILVVDDEPDMEFLFRQKFRKEIKVGMLQFNFVHSGEEALNLINQNRTEVVLILSDINMPGMSGLELLKRIKDFMKNIPVIMVSAYGDEKNYKQAMEYGAQDFVTKPIDFDGLKEKILEIRNR